LEKVYSFNITDVRTMNYLGKLKRGREGMERRPDFKKTIVTVKDLCWSYPEIEKSEEAKRTA
jgi:ribosomal protein L23